MTNDFKDKNAQEYNDDLNNICDECKGEDESVSQNVILTGFKICTYWTVCIIFLFINCKWRHGVYF